MSDADALEDSVNAHHYLSTYLEAAVAGIKAGCNLELTGDSSGWVYTYLTQVIMLSFCARGLRVSIFVIYLPPVNVVW